jgi:hypothetical protein
MSHTEAQSTQRKASLLVKDREPACLALRPPWALATLSLSKGSGREEKGWVIEAAKHENKEGRDIKMPCLRYSPKLQ